jgi:hypothetical protein
LILVKLVFPDKPYMNLENPDMRNFASEDPRAFLNQFSKGAILDEVKRTPELFSYLQQVLDEDGKAAQLILTGSNNFLLQQSITQSLAGRVGYLNLLPFLYQKLRIWPQRKFMNCFLKDFILRCTINHLKFKNGY